ncbi:protein NLRC5 isoform X1 [Pitangus sulphuratus]|nr:protein NLRC5 isoform X1 [Pitangus sulphuratus]
MSWAGRMILGIFRILLVLVHASAACDFGPFPYRATGIVCRMTKPAALLLNQETAQVIQAAFRNAKFPNITGERSVRLLGKVAYELTNIQVNGLSIEKSEVELKDNNAIYIAIKNVTASFKGTLTYGYAGAWFLRLFHSVDFEIESSIDLQLDIKLTCQEEKLVADASDCYLTFHKLTLHLQGDKEPGWLKQLFTDFISFTLKLVLKREVCKEINSLAQMLANFVLDLAGNFVRDKDIVVDLSLAAGSLIQTGYVESHHKGLVLFKNYSSTLSDSVFSPSLLTESRMLYFWLSEHTLSSLASAAFLDGRLVLTIRGEKLQALFEMEDTEAQRKAVQMIFQGTSYNDSVAKVWSLAHPQISLQPEGTVVKSLVAVEEITVTIQAAYAEKKLILQPLDSSVKFKVFKCTADPSGDNPSVQDFLQNMISVVGIPEVTSSIGSGLTSLMNSKGLNLFDIINPEIITRQKIGSPSEYGPEATFALDNWKEADHTTMQPPLRNDDLDLEAAVARGRPRLVEFLSRCPSWLLETSQRFLPELALNSLGGIADHREKISALLDLLEKAGPATWKQFAQYLCMECDLPLDLEVLLMSSAGEGNFSQTDAACTDMSARSSVPKGFDRRRRHCSSGSDKEAKQQRLDSSAKYRHLLMDSIRQRYGSRRGAGAEAEEQTQPLAFNQAFVNLVIRQNKAPRLKEKADKPREDVAGAPEPEECVDSAMKVLDLLCSAVPSGKTRVIFLFGKPGTGKTMLMHRICQKWAEGVLPQFLFTFLFEFRQLNLLKRKLTLKELLFDVFLQPEDSPDAVFQYLLENARQTLIIFDGLDEFAADMGVSSSKRGPALASPMSISQLFADLCHGKLLPGCTVLVTSRPKRLPDLLYKVSVLAEIWGFDQERVEEYVSRYFQQHSFKEQAIAHLKNNTKLLSMCLIPALCNVVCICLEYLLLKHQMSVELPQTMTQFYIKMFLIFLSKQQGECAGGEKTQLNCNKKAILGLCDLALKGLEEKKLVFYVGDIPEHVKEFASLHGLLTVFEVKTSGTCPEAGYAFVHLSLQEFFAALCLMVSRSVDKKYLKKNFFLKSKWTLKNETKTEFMESFHIFLSGLSSVECRTFLMLLAEQDEAWVQDKQDVILQSLKRMAATHLTGPKVLELCHCTFETQNLQVAQHIGSLLNFKYEFRNFRLTPLDMSALVFVINSGQDLTCLDFAGCLVDVDCLEVLAGCKNVEHLSFRSRRCGDDFAAALSKGLRGMGSLKKLELTGSSITAEGMTNLVQASSQCLQLEEINLQDNRIRDPEVKRVMDLFSRMENLKKIDLSNNHLSLNAVLALAEEVVACQNATELCVRSLDLKSEENKEHVIPTRQVKLCLQDRSLSPQHAKNVVAILQSCPCLSEVDLSQNCLSVTGICSLLKSVNTCQKAVEVQVRGEALFSADDQKYREENQTPTTPQKIRLTDSSFKGSDLKNLCAVLKECSHISELEFNDNQISLDSVFFLAQSLSSLEHIKTVSLSLGHVQVVHLTFWERVSLRDCRLGPEDMTRLCQILAQCPQLTEIDIRQNTLSPRCAVSLLNSINLCERIRMVDVRLTDCAIGEGQVDELCSVLEQHGWLAEVDLSHNRISQDGVLHLINAFITSGNTTEVQASLCSKATLILKLTSRNDPRKILRLSECNFQPEHLEKLFLLLEKCTGLTEYTSSNNNVTVQAAERLLHSLRKDLGSLKISIEEPWVSKGRVMDLLKLALQACGNITEITICKDKPLFQLDVRFPRCLEKVDSVVSRLSRYKPEIKQRSFYQRVCERCAQLQELRWSDVELHEDEAEMLVRILLPLPELKRFGLTSSSVVTTGTDYLIRGLQNCQAIEELNWETFSHAVIPEILEDNLEAFIQSLGCMKLSSAAIPQLVQGLCEMPSLKRLILNHNSIGNDGCSRLAEALRNMHHMEEINLSHNKIGDPGLTNLAAVLLEMQNLKKIKLSRNGFGDRTAVTLALCLPHMTNMKILHLSENDLGEQSIHALSKGLPRLGHLRKIDLKFCGITDDASKSLSHGFRLCPSVEEIILSWNALGDGGARELASALPEMEKLKVLDLEKNRIGACGAAKLAEELAKCPEIQSIRLWDNPVPKSLAEDLTSQEPRLCFSFS